MAVAVAAIMVHVPGTLLLVHYLGFAGAGWAVVVMRSAHLFFTIGESAMCTTRTEMQSPFSVQPCCTPSCWCKLLVVPAVYLLTLGRKYSRLDQTAAVSSDTKVHILYEGVAVLTRHASTASCVCFMCHARPDTAW